MDSARLRIVIEKLEIERLLLLTRIGFENIDFERAKGEWERFKKGKGFEPLKIRVELEEIGL